MKDHFLYPLFRKLRPKEAQWDDSRALQPFFELLFSLYLTPFVIVGLIWLFAASDPGKILEDPRGFVILFITLLIIQLRPASIPVRLGGRSFTNLTISLGSILVWVGLFIWGPVALVVDLLVSLILQTKAAWERSRYSGNAGWMFLSVIFQDITNTTLANLIGLGVYQAMGGQIPLESLLFVDWIPALLASQLLRFSRRW